MSDLARARDSLAAFAAIVGRPLTDHQAESLRLRTRYSVVVGCRQSGKSRGLALLALHRAFRAAEVRVLIVSAGEDASRRLLAEVRRTAAASPLLRGSLVDEQAGLVTLTNGSEIRSVSASEKAVRGWTADVLILDEAALLSDDLIEGAAVPTTAARPEARIVAASSPWGEGGAFHRWAMGGDSEHVSVRYWRVEDSPWITPESVEAARATMSPARFAAEYECRWSADSASLFTRAVLERCAADLSLPALDELRGPARLLGGCDWGVSYDRSAFAAIARLPLADLNPDRDPSEAVYVAWASAWPPGEPLSSVVSEVASSPAHFHALSSEVNGVGSMPTQELFRRVAARPAAEGGGPFKGRPVALEERPWVGADDMMVEANTGLPMRTFIREAHRRGFATRRNAVATDGARKAAAYERLRWLADQGRLVIPRDSELLRELAALRVELRPGGAEKIEAGRGHDDLADALYLASGPWRERRGGRVRVLLGDLAQTRTPEADAPPLEQPTVETGGGLRLDRRPPLQSVAGDELTSPAGVEPARRPRDPGARAAAEAAIRRHRQREEARSA